MNRYMYPIVFGLLVLGLGLFGCNGENSSDQENGSDRAIPDTIFAVRMNETYNVTLPPDTTAGTMSLYTSDGATPDTIMLIAAPPDTI